MRKPKRVQKGTPAGGRFAARDKDEAPVVLRQDPIEDPKVRLGERIHYRQNSDSTAYGAPERARGQAGLANARARAELGRIPHMAPLMLVVGRVIGNQRTHLFAHRLIQRLPSGRRGVNVVLGDSVHRGAAPALDAQRPLNGLMGLVQGAYGYDGTAKSPGVLIATMPTTDGRTRHVVSIPGTQPSLRLDRPTGAAASPATLAVAYALQREQDAVRDASGLARAVAEAMSRGGVGPDDEVLLVGHSLGGMSAAEVATTGKFNVRGVFTVGSPIAAYPVPDDIPVLAVEHIGDPVPALAGSRAPDQGHWRTIARTPPGWNPGPLDCHDAEVYRHTASRLDESTGEERMNWWREQCAPFTGADMQVTGFALLTAE